jgi:hypothetical protein
MLIPFLDVSRFDHLPESVVIERIGALLAVGVMRHQHTVRQRPASAVTQAPTCTADLVTDLVEQEIMRHLTKMGPATLIDLQHALGVSRSVLLRKLQHLRLTGLCLMEGHTRGVRYRLREDFSGN